MTSSELVLFAPLQEQWNYAKALASATTLPPEYRNKPGDVLLAMDYARALGLTSVAMVIQSVNVINGRPSMSAELMQALIRRAGHTIRSTGDRQQATCIIIRRDDPDFTYRATFTMDDARAAKLVKPDGNWMKYPQAMLLARAVSACARQACADVLAGVSYVPEELGDSAPPDALMAVVEQASASQEPPAPPAQGNGTPEPPSAPPAPPERPADHSLAGQERQRELDDLTGQLDAAVQAQDLEAILAVAQRAEANGQLAMVDEARAAWMKVHGQLVELEQQSHGQG